MKRTNEEVVDSLEAPRFYPTAEEFADFNGYVKKIEAEAYAHGMCIVVPPEGWSPRKNTSYDDVEELVVQKPIRQEFTGSKGVYYCVLLESRSQNLKKFRKSAEAFQKQYAPENNLRGKNDLSEEDKERYYWRNIRFRRPTYGADIQGSLFDEDVTTWNPSHLNTVLDLVGGMPGVTVPYLYFGMYGASFAWHTEDMDLYSINYIHFGAPKSWYYVPTSERQRFELLARKVYASHFDECKQFLRHKLAMLAPEVLTRNGVTYGKVNHKAGEFAVVFPGVYHAGFNEGFNCAESVNFGSESWLEWGKKAKACTCRPDTVTINCELLEKMIAEQGVDATNKMDKGLEVDTVLEEGTEMPKGAKNVEHRDVVEVEVSEVIPKVEPYHSTPAVVHKAGTTTDDHQETVPEVNPEKCAELSTDCETTAPGIKPTACPGKNPDGNRSEIEPQSSVARLSSIDNSFIALASELTE
ncbi:hypothetical protein NDN08_002539 [Rhodosorus marinus]|uniref:JmjC domain-containing protein n=1 Tax=Rhodosorus marinus TaxID=101924 RepID=A0AAV8UVF9_9RHOD|nr:hypothetical protein NDN08_002539 [Rhodosorus marinus]